MNSVTKGFALAALAAAMVGCSSTSQVEEPAPVDPVVTDTTDTGADASGVGGFGDVSSDDGYDDAAVALDTVFYFDFDQAVLNADARTALVGHADRLRSSGDSVTLEGHTDERGSREYNLALGERRAQAVRDFLILQGVDGSTIEVISFGEEKPADGGYGDAAMAANRRVEMK